MGIPARVSSVDFASIRPDSDVDTLSIPPCAILIADDDEAIAGILAKALRREGHDVAVAPNGRSAIMLLDERPGKFALLLLDVLMPVVDGIGVLHHVRRTSSEVACIMMTAWTNTWPPAMLLKAGANAVLTKPFDLHDVLATVRALLTHHHRKQLSRGIE